MSQREEQPVITISMNGRITDYCSFETVFYKEKIYEADVYEGLQKLIEQSLRLEQIKTRNSQPRVGDPARQELTNQDLDIRARQLFHLHFVSVKEYIQEKLVQLNHRNLRRVFEVILLKDKIFVLKDQLQGFEVPPFQLSQEQRSIAIARLPQVINYLQKSGLHYLHWSESAVVFYQLPNGRRDFILEQCLSRDIIDKEFGLRANAPPSANRFLLPASQTEEQFTAKCRRDWYAVRRLSCYFANTEFFEKLNITLNSQSEETAQQKEEKLVGELCQEHSVLRLALDSIKEDGQVNFMMFDSLCTVFCQELVLDCSKGEFNPHSLQARELVQQRITISGFQGRQLAELVGEFSQMAYSGKVKKIDLELNCKFVKITFLKMFRSNEQLRRCLRSLKAVACNINSECLTELTEPEYSLLQSVDLSRNPLRSSAVKIFQVAPNLEELKLNSCSLTTDSVDKFFRRDMHRLTSLQLDSNGFGSDSMFSLVDALSEMAAPSLKRLVLSNNRLDDDEFCALLGCNHPNLETVDLTNNLVREGLDRLIVKAWQQTHDVHRKYDPLPRLKELIIENNRIDTTRELGGLHVFTSLQKIYLHGNPIRRKANETIPHSVQFGMRRA